MKKTFLFSLFLFALLCEASAQKSPIKFGEIPMEQMTMATYDGDSSASAVVLADYGVAYIGFTTVSSSLTFERHIRIKILKKDGLNWANASIYTYHQGSTEERVTNLKASTYNLENGKIVETKLSKDGVFKDRFNKYFNTQKFTLPNVKEGSVIEYSYKINSEFLANFPNWEFQKEIPVMHSEYWAHIPEFFIFEKYMQGYLPLTAYEVKDQTAADFHEDAHHYVMKNVPAFKKEPYMTCEDDYLAKINFALAYIKIPGQIVQEVMGSWEKLNKELLTSENFGKLISRSGFLKEVVAQVTDSISDPLLKAEAIHSYVKKNFEWDGTQDKYSENLRKVFEEKKGTAADINLLLASMLDKAGLTVDMVLLSTRDHGFIRHSYPMEKQFNYVIVAIPLADKTILLDATDKYLPFATLPERCLNGQGLVISETHHGWIDIASKTKAKTLISAELSLLTSGELKGSMIFSRDGYDACNMRRNYFSKGEKDYLNNFLGARSWQVENTVFENVEELNKPVREIHDLNIDDHVSVVGDVMYLNPFVIGALEENPFKDETRLYPVDYGTAQEKTCVFKIAIPEGYAVDELPQSRMFVLPQNAAKYIYSVSQIGNIISVTSSLQINKSLFIQNEYPNLREFYNQVIAKQAEQIVLKKK